MGNTFKTRPSAITKTRPALKTGRVWFLKKENLKRTFFFKEKKELIPDTTH
jgi:hypothetical protein